MTKQKPSGILLDLCPRIRFARTYVNSYHSEFFRARTPKEKERSLSDCLYIAKLFTWVVEPLARESKTFPAAHLEYNRLATLLFDLGRGMGDAAAFAPTENLDVLLDQLENLTMQVNELREEIRAAGKTFTLRRAA